MPKGIARIFRFRCRSCDHLSKAKCEGCGTVYRFSPANAPGEERIQYRVWFGKRQLQRMAMQAKVSGMGLGEYIRMCVEDALAMPVERLLSSE